MRRLLGLAACAALAAAIVATVAGAAPHEVFRGHLAEVRGSAVKLRLEPSRTGDPAIVRSFTVRYFELACSGGETVTMRRAKISGEIPVGQGGGFRERDDDGRTVFRLHGRIVGDGAKARGTFRYSGAVDAGGGADGCDSGRLAWKARS